MVLIAAIIASLATFAVWFWWTEQSVLHARTRSITVFVIACPDVLLRARYTHCPHDEHAWPQQTAFCFKNPAAREDATKLKVVVFEKTRRLTVVNPKSMKSSQRTGGQDDRLRYPNGGKEMRKTCARGDSSPTQTRIVMVDSQPAAGIATSTVAALVVAVFVVSIGYGVVLPLLPGLIERLQGAGVQATQVSRHTGLLTAVYTLCLFLFSPIYGRLSDRYGPHGVLLFGLIGFGLTSLIFSFFESLAAIYAERALSGLFAAAVIPVAAAAAGKLTTTEQGRARRLAFVSMAGITGFLLGPMLDVFITRLAAYFLASAPPVGSIATALAATAALAFLAALAVGFAVPRGSGHYQTRKSSADSIEPTKWLVPALLTLSFIVSTGVGIYMVGLALRGKEQLGLTAYQIAVMFTECGLVMLVMQAIVFSPRFKPAMTRWLIAPALAILAAGLYLVPRASDFTWMLVVIGAVAASAGALTPIITYWISDKAGSAQGWELGKQTAASSLGATLGAAVGGVLFNLAILPGASFVLAATLTVLGFLLSLRLPHLLVPRKVQDRAMSANANEE